MIYLELFYVFFLVGLFTFGGGYAMIPLLESEIVGRGWLDQTTFYNMVSISESTPGPIAVNFATFVGNIEGGVIGALVATTGVILPSFIIILLIVTILTKVIDNKYVQAVLSGFKAVVVGLILSTACMFLYRVSVIDIKTFTVDIIGIIILGILVAISAIYKRLRKKNLSPYILLLISGGLGVLLYFIQTLII